MFEKVTKDRSGVIVSIDVRMEKTDYDRIVEMGEKVTNRQDAVTRLAKWLLDSYAKGGLMLMPSEVRQISTLLGGVTINSRAVVAAVEKLAERVDGGFTVRFTVDPTYVDPLKDIAEAQGRSVEDMLQDCMAHILANGWLYHVSGVPPVPVSELFHARLKTYLGKEFYDSDDVERLASDGMKYRDMKAKEKAILAEVPGADLREPVQ